MKQIKLLATDLAKDVFQLHGNDEFGNCIYKKQITRRKLMETIENMPKCTIVMDANYWYRQFEKMGHVAKQVPATYVKPFVKTNKNDAEAITEATSRPLMNFSKTKSIESQNMQSIHRMQSLYVTQKVVLANHICSILMEYGTVASRNTAKLKELSSKN